MTNDGMASGGAAMAVSSKWGQPLVRLSRVTTGAAGSVGQARPYDRSGQLREIDVVEVFVPRKVLEHLVSAAAALLK